MKKKISFMQILITIFTTILIVSFIFTFYILYYQQKSIVYSNIKNGLNEDSKDIKTYLDLTYKTIKLNDNSNINCEGYMKILEYVLKNNNFDSDGILIKDLDNNKIFYIKGNKKELFPISNSIQTIKLNDTEYVVKHFLYKNEIFNFDIILYSNISKVHYMVWNKIKKNFLLTIIFIVIILFILNILYNNLLIKPTNKLIDTMKLIVQEKKFYKIKDKFLVRESEDIKDVFNETIENIKNNQLEIEKLLKKSEYDKNFYLDILDSLDTIIIVNDGISLKSSNRAFFEFFDGFTSLEEFMKVHSCVCDYFIKEEGFIYAFENKNWVEYLVENSDKLHKAKIKKNDNIFIFKISAEKLKRSENIVITMADITQLEKDKEEIEILNNYLNQYMDFINKSSIVSKTDKRGIIIDVNEEFCKISGYSKEELIGQPHNIVRHPDTPKEVFKELWETILSGKIWKGEIKNRHKDGSDYYVKAIIAPIKDNNGNIQEFIAIRQDITDIIHAMQKAKEAEQAKMLFLSNMSHEIRTPLNGILGFTELLLKSKNIGGKEKRYLEIINSSGKGLLNIINDILDISKIESGHIILEEKEFNPAIAFNQTAQLFKAKALEKNIDYQINIDINPPVNVLGDEYKIKQVISNLLNNAIKFTPENGKVELVVKKEKETEKYLTLCFYVKDTGIGIPKDKQKTIFEAFSQADNSITRKFGGTGLGLNISSKIVKKMGSKLKVESEEGKGSTFYFCIDLKKSKNKNDLMVALESIVVKMINCDKCVDIKNYLQTFVKEVLVVDKLDKINDNDLIFTKDEKLLENFSNYRNHFIIVGKDIPNNFNHSKILDSVVDFLDGSKTIVSNISNKSIIDKFNAKVLIVEDNLVNQQFLSALLDEKEIKYEIANDGLEAIEKFKNDKFDLIFMDMNMPNMDGIEATKRIKVYEKENMLKHTPIVMLTANAMTGDKEKFLEVADGYLAKPIDSNKLLVILNKFLKNKTEVEDSKEKIIEEAKEVEHNLEYNKQEVAKSIGLPEVVFNKILETFFENIKIDMENLEKAIESVDFDAISKAVHKIKGGSATIKFNELAEIAKTIEESAREEKEIDYKNEFLQMKKVLSKYKEILE